MRSARRPGRSLNERVLAVVRNKTLRRFYDPTVAKLEVGDQVVVVRQANEAGLARRTRRTSDVSLGLGP